MGNQCVYDAVVEKTVRHVAAREELIAVSLKAVFLNLK